MKKEGRQRNLARLILLLFYILNVFCSGDIVKGFYYDESVQADALLLDSGNAVGWKSDISFINSNDPTEQISNEPHVSIPLIEEGNDISTAIGLADYYGISIADIRGILPDWIPTTDEILFEAYIQLFTHTTPIFFGPNGMYQTSGYDLGVFIAENKISIAWEDKSIVDCGLNGKACVDRNNSDPTKASTIFIVENGYSPINISDIYAGRIAHEAFHLTFPYGDVNSKLEEMDANRIGSIIIGSNTSDDYGTPDYRPEAIYNWVAGYCSNIFGHCTYENLPLYPNSAWKALFTTTRE